MTSPLNVNPSFCFCVSTTIEVQTFLFHAAISSEQCKSTRPPELYSLACLTKCILQNLYRRIKVFVSTKQVVLKARWVDYIIIVY